jgi:hypothetical protein
LKSRYVLALSLVCVAGCADPVRSDGIDALGDERPGVPEGPLHRPGEPCVLCHGGSGPGDPEFAFAGTVYQVASSTVPLANAIVRLVDSRGVKFETGTNCVGNFYVRADDYRPVFPVWTKVVFGEAGGVPVEQIMGSPIYRERSCAKCHGDPVGPESAGHVYFAPDGVPFPSDGCPQ